MSVDIEHMPSQHPFTRIDGIADIADKYEGFIFDIYGVIHNGIELFSGTHHCLEQLMDAGKRICLLSNTPKLDDAIRADLKGLGLSESLYHGVVTAGDSAREAVKNFSGTPCWFSGHPAYHPIIEGTGCEALPTNEGAKFILNAISGLYPMGHDAIVNELEQAIQRNLTMICANPDLVVMVGKTQHVCAGTYAELYEKMGGIVSYHGKPHKPVYAQAQRLLNIDDKSKIVSVGDSLHTDIQGANRFGIDCVFNVDGIHFNEIACAHTDGGIDFGKLASLVESQSHKPTYALNGFAW